MSIKKSLKFKYRDGCFNKKFLRAKRVQGVREIKICSKCKKRKVKFHHYLCSTCWEEKRKEYENEL